MRCPRDPGHAVRPRVGHQDVHRSGRGRPGQRRGAVPRRPRRRPAPARVPPVDAARRRRAEPPAAAHVRHRRLRRGGRGHSRLRRGLRVPVGRPAQLLDAPADRLPAAVRRPAAVPAAGRTLAVLQRRLRAPRHRPRARHRTRVRRPRAGARLRPGGHDEHRVPEARRAASRRGRRLPGPRGPRRTAADEHLLGPRHRRGRRWRAEHAARPEPLPRPGGRRVPDGSADRRDARPARGHRWGEPARVRLLPRRRGRVRPRWR